MNKTLYVVATILLCSAFVIGAIPDTLNIHGKLLNNGGSPQTGTFNMNFSIYDVASGGANIYSQTQSVTTDENGIYTLILSGLTGVNFSQQTYLGVTVESDSEMQPRINITSTPSALAPEAGGGGSSLWTEGVAGDIYYNSGSVGIDTSNPSGQLDISGAGSTTIVYIDNTALNGDPQLQFQLSGVTKYSMGIDDTGDVFEIASATGLTIAPKFSISTSQVTMGTKMAYNKISYFVNGDSTPSVSSGNVFRMTGSTDITDFDTGSNGQVIYVYCNIGSTLSVIDSGTINLAGGADFTCSQLWDLLVLIQLAPNDWVEVSRTNM